MSANTNEERLTVIAQENESLRRQIQELSEEKQRAIARANELEQRINERQKYDQAMFKLIDLLKPINDWD